MVKVLKGDIDELAQARAIRLADDRKAPMSERLARVHGLCKQMSAVKGAVLTSGKDTFSGGAAR